MKRRRPDDDGETEFAHQPSGILLQAFPPPPPHPASEEDEDDFVQHLQALRETADGGGSQSAPSSPPHAQPARVAPPARKKRKLLTGPQNYVASLPPIDPVTGVWRDEAYAMEEAVPPPDFEPLDAHVDNELQERCLLCNYGHPTFDKGPNGFELFADMCNTIMLNYTTIGIGGAIRQAHVFYDEHIIPLFQDAELTAPIFDAEALRDHLDTIEHSINSHLMLVQQIRKTAKIQGQVFREIKERGKRCDEKTIKLWTTLSKHLIFLYGQSPDKRMTFAAPHRSEFHPDTVAHVTRTHAFAAAVAERRIQPHVARLLASATSAPQATTESDDSD